MSLHHLRQRKHQKQLIILNRNWKSSSTHDDTPLRSNKKIVSEDTCESDESDRNMMTLTV